MAIRLWGWAVRRCYSSSGLVRNIAIIAHVDHGKTTLVDCLLRQSGSVADAAMQTRLMDSNALEKERGITILSKCTSINFGPHRINVVDTPGHADFGGEVERALSMVDGVVLVVDATEGPMAQTKFVLSKALKKNLQPIVVFNKVDRATSRCDEVDSELLDLFSALGASDEQMGYSSVYASAKDGWAFGTNPYHDGDYQRPVAGNMSALFELIVRCVPAPKVRADAPFSLLVNSIEPNQYVGRCYLGKVASGRIAIGDRVRAVSPDGTASEEGKLTKIFLRRGLEQVDLAEASAGDIVSIAGVAGARPNYTIGAPELLEPLPSIDIDPPTVSMFFLVNTSPLAGSEGKAMTSQSLLDRLRKECENNIAIQLKPTEHSDVFEVSGRGEMQLGVLLETIRREGHELAVSPPRVVLRRGAHAGDLLEPFEEVTVDCNMEYAGSVIEKLSKRKAELLRMTEVDAKARLVFKCPMRGLIGYSAEFRNDTHGTGILNHAFLAYEPHSGEFETSRKGCLISMADGVATAYAIAELESRGTLFIEPGMRIYAGMIVGESSRDLDLEVNPTRAKVLTNMRTTQKEDFFRLATPKIMGLEESIAYVADDEIIEITPKMIRLRKSELDSSRRRSKARAKSASRM